MRSPASLLVVLVIGSALSSPASSNSMSTSSIDFASIGYVTGSASCTVGGETNSFEIPLGSVNGCSDGVGPPPETGGWLDARIDSGSNSRFPHDISFSVGHPDFDANVVYEFSFSGAGERSFTFAFSDAPNMFSVIVNGQLMSAPFLPFTLDAPVVTIDLFVPLGQSSQLVGGLLIVPEPSTALLLGLGLLGLGAQRRR